MYEFHCAGPITVDLRLGGGTCEIRAETGETATVEIEPFDGSEAGREAASQTRVELSGDTLTITAPEAGGWLFRRAPRLRVIATVPTGSTGRLRVASADLTCHGQWSELKANTASGDLYVEQVSADLSVNSASGDVRVNQVGGRLNVNTASGDVSATRVAGHVEVKGASADVEVEELGGGLRSSTASGDLRIGTARQGDITVNSASGDVSIGVQAGTGVWMDLNTLSGRTRSDLEASDGTPPNGHELSVQVRTISGDIELHRVNRAAAA